MHPATRQMIYGTIALIKQALGQIEGILSAEEQGFESGPAIAQTRIDMSKSGNESVFCNDKEEQLIAAGFQQMMDDANITEDNANDEPFKKPVD